MQFRKLFVTTLLSSSLVIGVAACSMDTHTSTSANGNYISDEEASRNPRLAAAKFIKQINYARLAIAMNNGAMAKQHIAAARDTAMAIRNESAEQHTIEGIKAGLVAYNERTSYEYFYFPIEAEYMHTKKTKNPKWMHNKLKISDAEVVNITLNINDDEMQRQLTRADTAINEGNLQSADKYLARLSRNIVTSYVEILEPLDKARDNIDLARRFLSEGNYDGARYALKHADNALNDMQEDDDYQKHHDAIVSMRKNVQHMQEIIAERNPTTLQKADAKIGSWWTELKSWARN